MEYVRGTDINALSKFWLKRVADGRIEIHESLRSVLSYELLSNMLTEAKQSFVTADGKVIKDMPQAEILFMTKKINKKKYIIGLSEIKRVAGEPSTKKGIERWFEESTDKFVEGRRFFAEGLEKELAYFDHSMIEHLRNSVGSGQAGEAEYKDKLISRVKTKKILGITVTRTVLFIAMLILWGLAFKNLALGLCFAICFLGSFTIVTNKAMSEQKDLAQTEV
ncbi:MAG: hypothetical protein IKT10_06215 [Clostridiales bacterium]|nr:hypothetical protein [Clostridiales bacterium]